MHILNKAFKQKFSLSLFQFNFLLALWLTSTLNLYFFHQLYLLTPYRGLKTWGFLFASFIIIFSAYHLILQIINWRIHAKWIAGFLIIIGGLSAYFVNGLGITITPDQIQNMLQTDPKEVKDLISTQFLIWFSLFIIAPLLLFFYINIKPSSWQHTIRHKLFTAISSVILILCSLFIFYVDYAAIFRENRDLKGMISPQNVFSASSSYWHKQAPKEDLPLVHYGTDAHLVLQANQNNQPKIMVLVVGETARAESFSLNGYQRNTNPKLANLDIINFTQVSSCGTATAVSLPCMFSGMKQQNYDPKLAHHREGLLDLAQRAGYQVTWIDNNSGCKDTCNRVQNYQIPTHLKQKWCKDDECYDEILVDSLHEFLTALPKDNHKPQLIVLHQMGSHGPAYYKRSKPSYQPFKPSCDSNAIQGCDAASLINSYDNTIVYTDHVLSALIQTLNHQPQLNTALWYLSDHGESTGEHGLYLHGAPYAIAPSEQTHIPMLMWFSSTWQQFNAEQVTCLAAQKNHQLSHDNLFPTLLKVLDIDSTTINSADNMLNHCTTLSSNRV